MTDTKEPVVFHHLRALDKTQTRYDDVTLNNAMRSIFMQTGVVSDDIRYKNISSNDVTRDVRGVWRYNRHYLAISCRHDVISTSTKHVEECTNTFTAMCFISLTFLSYSFLNLI